MILALFEKFIGLSCFAGRHNTIEQLGGLASVNTIGIYSQDLYLFFAVASNYFSCNI